jgi:hypothetical protein
MVEKPAKSRGNEVGKRATTMTKPAQPNNTTPHLRTATTHCAVTRFLSFILKITVSKTRHCDPKKLLRCQSSIQKPDVVWRTGLALAPRLSASLDACNEFLRLSAGSERGKSLLSFLSVT